MMLMKTFKFSLALRTVVFPLNPFLSYVNQPVERVSTEAYHVVNTTNICVNIMPGRVEGKICWNVEVR